ncbi:MAG: hypothetical protein Q8M02_12945 [Candidatus Didemnitutus sp.]|nr:hypothetical protein [Candidatus Didemnitutus sp.]
MNLEPAPRLSKWIFLAVDAGLLLIAAVIVYFAKDPYAPLPFVSAVLCVSLAAIISLVPFLVDYAAEHADAAEGERQRVNEQIARLHAATESLARTAAQIKAVEEAVHKASREAETLPYRMQEKLAEFNDALTNKDESDREALENELEELRSANSAQLKATAEKIIKATADWAALEVATRQQFTAAEATLQQLQIATAETSAQLEEKFARHLSALDARLARAASAPAASQVPSTDSLPDNTVCDESPAVEITPASESITEESSPAAVASEPPKPRKPRAPRKPKSTEETSAPAPVVAAVEANGESISANSATAANAAAEFAHESGELDPSESSDDSDAAPTRESATSADGATRLLATAYIGIGNKLFIRGDGPGLSWDKGAAMQFVSIGKWGWSSQDAVGPVHCKLYKNDDVADLTGEIILEPGRHTEITALF